MTKTILAALFLVLSLSTISHAETNPFAACSQATGDVSYLNCRIAVVDEYLLQEFGPKAVKAAEELADKKCAHNRRMNMAPKLILLSSLQCKFDTKLDYYEELAK